jgi:hypothetical protein
MNRRSLLSFVLWMAAAFALFVVGVLILNPIYVDVCEAAKNGTAQKCEKYQILLAALLKIGHVLSHAEMWTALGTIAIAAFTYTLKRSTDNLWDITRKAAARQEEDTRTLQRAYISVEPGGVRPLADDPDKCLAHVIIRNVGHLPARKTRWSIAHDTSKNHSLQDSDLPINENDAEGGVVLTPGGRMRHGGKAVSRGDGKGELRPEKDLYFYVWGIVIYDDGFGNVRRTRFCHRYNCVNFVNAFHDDRIPGVIKSQPIGRKIAKKHGRQHRHGNEAD